MALWRTNLCLEMLSPSDMIGHFSTIPHIVIAAMLSVLIMLCHVPQEDFHQLGTMS